MITGQFIVEEVQKIPWKIQNQSQIHNEKRSTSSH